jgi:UDP-N-acetylmuramate--alanine ligase
MKHAIRHIHFVGLGGSGMSGIAEVLFNLGYTVSGSDLADSATLRRLHGLGIRTCVGHDRKHIDGADAVVTSTAVQADNPEVLAAREKRIPVVPRALMLAELMRLKQGIAIAGTHGKTTTTSLVTSVLAEAGLDPTFVIGGRLNSAGANARLGGGDYIVVEADESDASFLNLLPVMAVVTNIDADHMETYGHDFGRLKGAFVDFLHRMPFYGAAILCMESPAVREIVPQVTCPVTTYGFAEDAEVRATDVRAVGAQMHFTVQRRNGVVLPDLAVVLNLPGRHNVLNALSAIAVAVELNIPDEAVLRALAGFGGVGRRFQRYGDFTAEGGRFALIDDYGHHPVEMAATLAAARGAFPGRRLVLAFQPHRYSRTRDCFEDFVQVIGQHADTVLLAEVYAAGEAPIVAADGRSLARALRVAGAVEPVFVADIADMPRTIAATVRDGDVVICMGAGSIGAVPGKVAELLHQPVLPAAPAVVPATVQDAASAAAEPAALPASAPPSGSAARAASPAPLPAAATAAPAAAPTSTPVPAAKEAVL